MKKSRFFLVATLALATAFTFVACSDDDNKEKSEPEVTNPDPDQTEPGAQTDDYYYELLSSEATIDCQGGVVEFQIHTDIEYAVNVISGSEWLTVESEGTEDEAAEETYTVVLVVGMSTLAEERYGEVEVTFYYEGEEVGTATFTVTQEAYEAPYAEVTAMSETELTWDKLNKGEASIYLMVSTNMEQPEVTFSDDWLYLYSQNETSIMVGVNGYNELTNSYRTGIITVTFTGIDFDEEGNEVEYVDAVEIEVTQYGRETMQIEDLLGHFLFSMDSGYFTIDCDYYWTAIGETGTDTRGDYTEITGTYAMSMSGTSMGSGACTVYYYEGDDEEYDSYETVMHVTQDYDSETGTMTYDTTYTEEWVHYGDVRPLFYDPNASASGRIDPVFDEDGVYIAFLQHASIDVTYSKVFDEEDEEEEQP